MRRDDAAPHAPALFGVDRLPDLELLVSLLGGDEGRRRRLAAAVLATAGSLERLRNLGRAELRRAGLGPAEVQRFEAALELGRRAQRIAPRAKAILDPADGFACVAAELCGAATERFVVAALDAKNRPLRVFRAAEGGVDHCPVDVREVFAPALRERASAVLVAHNHPSGDPRPSDADLELTRRLRRAGALLGITVVDHLIVGGPTAWISLAEQGLLAD